MKKSIFERLGLLQSKVILEFGGDKIDLVPIAKRTIGLTKQNIGMTAKELAQIALRHADGTRIHASCIPQNVERRELEDIVNRVTLWAFNTHHRKRLSEIDTRLWSHIEYRSGPRCGNTGKRFHGAKLSPKETPFIPFEDCPFGGCDCSLRPVRLRRK